MQPCATLGCATLGLIKKRMRDGDEENARPQFHRCLGCHGHYKSLSHHLARRHDCAAIYAATTSLQPSPQSDGLAALRERSDLQRAHVKDQVACDLAELRWEKMVSNQTVDGVKSSVKGWLQSVEASLVKDLQPCISPTAGIDVAALLHERLGIFSDIETARLERNYYQGKLGSAYVEPVRRVLGSHVESVKDSEGKVHSSKTVIDVCWDIPLIAQLQALIDNDPGAWKAIQSASTRWSSPKSAKQGLISDIEFGKVMLLHEKLGAKSGVLYNAEGEEMAKTAWQSYNDEVETCNSLGFAAGKHKILGVYTRLINFDPSDRDDLKYTFVNTVCLSSVVKRYGMTAVIGGVDVNYKDLTGAVSSLGGQMRLFDKGVNLSVPQRLCAASAAGYKSQPVGGWLIYMCADFPAAGACLPFAESVSAGQPCRGCNWQRLSRRAFNPSSFVEKGAGIANSWHLHTLDEVHQKITAVAKVKAVGARHTAMRADGLYKLAYTLHPQVFPWFNGMTMCPQDVMHCEFSSGIANSELAALIYLLVRMREFTVEQLNVTIYLYDFEEGHRPPALHASVASGTMKGKPKHDCHLRWSGSQTLHFAQVSVDLIGGLLSPSALRSPAWKAWLAHMSYLEILLRTHFTYDDVLELDRRVRLHQKLYRAVPEYEGLDRPKHHFATHYANDILNNGPPRMGWCFGCVRFLSSSALP